MPGSGVVHVDRHQRRRPVAWRRRRHRRRHRHGAALAAVVDGVGDDVVEHSRDQRPVGVGRQAGQAVRLEAHAAMVGGAPQPRERLVDQVGQVDLAQRDVAGALLCPGQQDQVLGQGGQRRQPAAHVDQGVAIGVGAARMAQRDVELAGHRRERPAQLVGGIGSEPAMRVHRALQAVEHRVEQHRHAADFVVHVRSVEPGVEVALGDPGGAFGDAGHRRQRPRGQPVADGRRWRPRPPPTPRRAARPAPPSRDRCRRCRGRRRRRRAGRRATRSAPPSGRGARRWPP